MIFFSLMSNIDVSPVLHFNHWASTIIQHLSMQEEHHYFAQLALETIHSCCYIGYRGLKWIKPVSYEAVISDH